MTENKAVGKITDSHTAEKRPITKITSAIVLIIFNLISTTQPIVTKKLLFYAS